ncbi:MAG: hypothetical protein R3C01_08795 [Planctomycetaceae bacterium]
MNHQYWGMKRDPFSDGTPDRLLTSTLHEEAVARCEYLVEQRRLCGVVVGPEGSGKSDILRMILSGPFVGPLTPAVLLDLTGLDGSDMLRRIAIDLGLSDRLAHGDAPWEAVNDAISGLRECGGSLVLLLDHLERVSHSALMVVERLLSEAAVHRSATVLCTVAAPLTPSLNSFLRRYGELKIEVAPLNVQQTGRYLEDALRSGGRRNPVFEIDAVSLIQELTGGRPRDIERLTRLALLAGQVEGATVIDQKTVAAAARELPSGDTIREVASAR